MARIQEGESLNAKTRGEKRKRPGRGPAEIWLADWGEGRSPWMKKRGKWHGQKGVGTE